MMTPQIFQKWLDITKALAADASAVIRCPQCENADLEIQDSPAPGYEVVIDRYACCSACGVKGAVPKPRGGSSTPESEIRWRRLCERLLALGWTLETVEVEDGLRSPHDAMVICADMVVTDGHRAMLTESLGRHCATLRAHIPESEGWDMQRQKDVLGDFQQMLDCLAEPDCR